MSIYEPRHTRECESTKIDDGSRLPNGLTPGYVHRRCTCGGTAQAQRDDEAWMHAACLSIAEGVPSWEKPLEHDSLAMRAVRDLRLKYEEAMETNAFLGERLTTLLPIAQGIQKERDDLLRQQQLDQQASATRVDQATPLADLNNRYMRRVGEGEGKFVLRVWRVWPKIAPGGRKADGFLAEYSAPIDEATIHAQFGGGEYIVRASEKNAPSGLVRARENVRVLITGEPIFDRQDR